MNKRIIGIVVAILLIGGAIYLFTRGKSDNTQTESSQSTTTQAESANDQETSLKSLMASGRSQKCTFSSTENNATSEGTFYVASGKSRGDFSTTASGKTIMSHMIYDGTTSYVWTNDSTSGFKMAVSSDQSQSTQGQSVNPNQNYNYKCDSWSADNSMFQPPSNINFTEFKVQGEAMMEDSSLPTDMCDNMSEPARTQCLNAIKKP